MPMSLVLAYRNLNFIPTWYSYQYIIMGVCFNGKDSSVFNAIDDDVVESF